MPIDSRLTALFGFSSYPALRQARWGFFFSGSPWLFLFSSF